MLGAGGTQVHRTVVHRQLCVSLVPAAQRIVEREQEKFAAEQSVNKQIKKATHKNHDLNSMCMT
jgi:hypothetical protein